MGRIDVDIAPEVMAGLVAWARYSVRLLIKAYRVLQSYAGREIKL